LAAVSVSSNNTASIDINNITLTDIQVGIKLPVLYIIMVQLTELYQRLRLLHDATTLP
jgi:hypothetical protein